MKFQQLARFKAAQQTRKQLERQELRKKRKRREKRQEELKNDLQSGIEQRIEESRLQREEAQRQEDETLGSRDRGVVAPLGTRELMELQSHCKHLREKKEKEKVERYQKAQKEKETHQTQSSAGSQAAFPSPRPKGAWRHEAKGVSKRYGLSAEHLRTIEASLQRSAKPHRSIVAAVEKGRAIYSGIQKFVAFIMSVHIAEVMQIFVCIAAGVPVMRTESNSCRNATASEGHEELKASGLLYEWREDMLCIFVSHQWLGRRNPDPSGHQLRVLQQALENIMGGRTQVCMDTSSQFLGYSHDLSDKQRLAMKEARIHCGQA
eukprot:g2705.t1